MSFCQDRIIGLLRECGSCPEQFADAAPGGDPRPTARSAQIDSFLASKASALAAISKGFPIGFVFSLRSSTRAWAAANYVPFATRVGCSIRSQALL